MPCNVLATYRGGGVVMGGRIVAELAVLADGEQAFEQVLMALRDELAGLDAELAQNLSAWDGDAKAAYRQAHATWRAAADDMAERLAGLKKVLGVGHRNYGRSLAANVSMWHGA